MTSKIPDTLEELNIKYFKLMNGDSIIAYTHDLDAEHGAAVGLEEPMLVTINSTTPNDFTFIPWFPFTTGGVHLLDSYNILAEAEVDVSMKAYYMKVILGSIEEGTDSAKAITNEAPDKDTVIH
jgi:hypothetical protein